MEGVMVKMCTASRYFFVYWVTVTDIKQDPEPIRTTLIIR